MRFAINGNEKDIREITLRTWDGNQWSQDQFDDMETNFPSEHVLSEYDFAYVCTEVEYNELVEWWTKYVDDANNHRICDNLDDWTEYAGPELGLFAD